MKHAALLTLLLSCLLLGMLAGCGGPKRTKAPASESKNEFELNGIEMLVYDQADLQTILRAEKAAMDTDEQVTQLERITALIYNKGEVSGQIEAGTGILYMQARPEENIGANDFVLDGEVQLNREGLTVRVPRLYYDSDNSSEAFRTSGGRFFQTFGTGDNPLKIAGDHLVASRDFMNWRAQGPGRIWLGKEQ